MKNLRKSKGFTIIEAMMATAIAGVVLAGVYKLAMNGTYMWNMGSARLALDEEMRMVMLIIKKTIQLSQGASIEISRIDDDAPANSYLSAILGETIYITSNRVKCGLGISGDPEVLGTNGQPVEIYQYKNYIRMVVPKIRDGTDLRDAAAIRANTYYNTMTITANTDTLNFAFTDTKDGTQIAAAVRLSKLVMDDRPLLTLFNRETVTIKRTHSAGYYYD